MEQRLRLLNLIIYGPKSEKKPRTGQAQQLSLFDEAEQTVEEQTPQTFEEACTPAHTRGKRGRRPIPADLPRVEIVHDLPESEKACPCGAILVRIGEEVSEKLDIVPAKIQVIRHIRPKYACRVCEGVEDDGPTVKTAPMPPQLIPQGIVTPGLLAHVAIAKYADALPLYRQEDQFARLGLDITRGTLAGWMIRVSTLPLRALAGGNYRCPTQGPPATTSRSLLPDHPCLSFCRFLLALTRRVLLSAYGQALPRIAPGSSRLFSRGGRCNTVCGKL
nr:IS66 family transposase zinc-finger binding domain-containing protein [Solidesulfovibrio aerotolerans]